MLEAWFALPSAVLAAGAAWRAHTTARAIDHVGLGRLRWTFALLAMAALVQTVQALGYEASLASGGPVRGSLGVFDALFWLQHGLVLVALAVAVPTHARVGALVPILLIAAPVLYVIEAAGFMALTVQGARNHVRRATGASLPAAVGYLALTTATAASVWAAAPLGPRPWWIEAIHAVGLALLWRGIPRRPSLG